MKAEDYSAVLERISKFHSVLNIAWPKPGNIDMSGASVFINTNLFSALESGSRQIEQEISSITDLNLRTEIISFWNSLVKLFLCVCKQKRGSKITEIDYSLNLIYLASGICFHRLAKVSSALPTRDGRLIGVESVEKLLQLCQWKTSDSDVENVFKGVQTEMILMLDKLE